MSVSTAIAFAFALLSTTLASLAYLREHDAAAALPALTLRHPLQSLRLLLTDRAWLLGLAGAALTVAGLATLLTNLLPILAGTIVLQEPVPSGALGALRVLAFVAVAIGAVLLAHPDGQAVKTSGLPVES
jgi:hypothetical protein